MNNIGNWHNPKQFLPLPDKLVLLDLGGYTYRLARLFEILQPEAGEREETEVSFLSESDSEGYYHITDVEAWAYMELDKVNFREVIS